MLNRAFSVSTLTLGTVINHENLRVASTLLHRLRSSLIHQSHQKILIFKDKKEGGGRAQTILTKTIVAETLMVMVFLMYQL